MHDSKVSGALTGAAVAAAASWARYDDETQRRLRNIRLDAEEALDLVRDMQGRGEATRSRLPVVNDAQVGLALSNSTLPTPAVVPSATPITRPDLCSTMEVAAAEMSWPPQPGEYDDRGMVKQVGELTSTFLALTFEENRAFFQGLAQSKPPSRDAKVQVFFAANALVAQLCGQKLTWQQYKDAWARLFGNVTTMPSVDSHLDPTRAPSAGSLAAGVVSVLPLTSLPGGVPGYPYANRNTDKGMRFRISTSGVLGAHNAICTVTFGNEFRDESGPFQPVVLVNGDLPFYAVNITSQSFVLKSTQSLANALSYDFCATTVRSVGS